MTNLQAMRKLKLPTIRWGDRYGQWYVRIGYRRSKSGKRQRRMFYLGRCESAAVAEAARLKGEWLRLKRSGTTEWPNDAAPIGPSLVGMSPDAVEAAVSNFHDEQGVEAVETGQVEETTPQMRLEQVSADFIRHRHELVGTTGGLKESTVKVETNLLNNAVKLVNGNTTMDRIDFGFIEEWRTQVVSGNRSGKTCSNYLSVISMLLNWAETRKTGYVHPTGVAQLFRHKRLLTAPRVERYDAERLNRLLGGCDDMQRLWIYLGLNCGFYQVDIANLRRDELVDGPDGTSAIQRYRDKTSATNQFPGYHVLWSETARLLNAVGKSDSADGRLLKSKTGTILRTARTDLIGKHLRQVGKDTDAHIEFKQYRKFGATAIQRLGGDECRRLYKVGQIDSGDKSYVHESREKLTQPLLQWGEELRRDGVLW